MYMTINSNGLMSEKKYWAPNSREKARMLTNHNVKPSNMEF